MSDKEITMEDLEETAQQTEEQLDLLAWKMEGDQDLAVPVDSQDMCVMTLLKSVSEPVAFTLTEGAVGLHGAPPRAGRGAATTARAVRAAAGSAAAGAWEVC
ncbi:uncharacterized protein LOC134800401 isoform X2 [Cydia splendana]|uniref:uncharacterized protein LOC134800401 isoform X2 n=1 Tax=Cydia splendana TaxID=1100963 RepID=UPI00212E18B8